MAYTTFHLFHKIMRSHSKSQQGIKKALIMQCKKAYPKPTKPLHSTAIKNNKHSLTIKQQMGLKVKVKS